MCADSPKKKNLHSDLESPSLVRHHPNPHHEEVAAGSLAAGWDPGAYAGHHPSATARSVALPVSCATSESQPIAARHAPISYSTELVSRVLRLLWLDYVGCWHLDVVLAYLDVGCSLDVRCCFLFDCFDLFRCLRLLAAAWTVHQ